MKRKTLNSDESIPKDGIKEGLSFPDRPALSYQFGHKQQLCCSCLQPSILSYTSLGRYISMKEIQIIAKEDLTCSIGHAFQVQISASVIIIVYFCFIFIRGFHNVSSFFQWKISESFSLYA